MTNREREVIQLIANDMDNASIAEALHISIETVETHRKNMMRKMNAKTAAGMVVKAIQQGIITLDIPRNN
jgi:DNA-binding CsgD family transcriptional regulator